MSFNDFMLIKYSISTVPVHYRTIVHCLGFVLVSKDVILARTEPSIPWFWVFGSTTSSVVWSELFEIVSSALVSGSITVSVDLKELVD